MNELKAKGIKNKRCMPEEVSADLESPDAVNHAYACSRALDQMVHAIT